MSYVVLARRYRPQTLDQVIGQEHISRTLSNAIADNRVAHAYLFSGPRGCGKTTTARILAKALNCKTPKGTDPCGVCPNCLEITGGSSIDVQEIDGASNRGIDEIRALRDNVKFAPASSKYKIYIIDEAHQITDAAFNALLKTLEEPPDHVIFVLATTEPQKIPVTILSRCQRYRFRLLSSKEILGALEAIVGKESVTVDSAALKVVTSASGGSMRDALSLLDQAISVGAERVTAADIENLLGALPRRILVAAADALAAEDLSALLALVKEISDQGYNLIQFGRDLREHLRRVLLYIVNPDILEDATDEERAIYEAQKGLFTAAWLIRAGHVLSRAVDEMRWSDQPRLVLESYLLKLAQKYVNAGELLSRLEKLEKDLPLEPLGRPVPAAPSVPRPAAPAPAARPEIREPAPAAAPAPAAPVAVPAAPADAAARWVDVVHEIQRSRPIVAQVLADARLSSVSGTNLIIGVHNKFQEEGISRNRALIEPIVQKIFGAAFGVKTVIETAPRAAAAVAPAADEIVVPEEMEAAPGPAVYAVEGDLTGTANAVPPEVEKIRNTLSGRITKKK